MEEQKVLGLIEKYIKDNLEACIEKYIKDNLEIHIEEYEQIKWDETQRGVTVELRLNGAIVDYSTVVTYQEYHRSDDLTV